MVGPRRRRCAGCHALRAEEDLQSGVAGAKCCSGCAHAARRADTGLPRWRECTGCARGPCRCFPLPDSDDSDDSGSESDAFAWLCTDCRRVDDLRRGVLAISRLGATQVQVDAFLALHLCEHVHVDIWIVPITPRCILILIRVILWRRFGVLAGVVLGVCWGWYSHVLGVC